MANLQDILKLAQQSQTQQNSPYIQQQAQQQPSFVGLNMQNLMQILQKTSTPNTSFGRISGGISNTYNQEQLNQNQNQFAQGVSQIAQSDLAPDQKMNLLISNMTNHGVNAADHKDILDAWKAQMENQTKVNNEGNAGYKPKTQAEALQFEQAKYGVKLANPSPSDQKATLDLQDRQKARDFATQDLKETTKDTLDTIAEVEKGINNFGINSGYLGTLPSIPGTSRAKWEANVNKLLAGKVIGVIQAMKQASRTGATGFGQLSDKEGKILADASTALKRNLAPKDAQNILNDMKVKLNKILQDNGGQPSGNTGGNQDFSSLWS